MDIKAVLNTLQDELEGATSTHLADCVIYRGDIMAWNDTKAIFLVWLGCETEVADAIGDGESFTDVHRVDIDIRQKFNDPTGAITDPSAWYDDFLELFDEVKAEIALKGTRRFTSGGQHANKIQITGVDAGYIGEGQVTHYGAVLHLAVYVPQA